MEILVYGETKLMGSGAWCYAETIISMGHQLSCYQDDTYLKKYRTSVFWKILRKLNQRQILPADRRKHVTGLIELANRTKPDVIIILKGLFLDNSVVDELKIISPFVVNINHDDFFSLNRNNISQLLLKAISNYDYVFTTRKVNVAEVSLYNQQVEFFPFSYYPPIHKQVVLTEHEKIKYKTPSQILPK